MNEGGGGVEGGPCLIGTIAVESLNVLCTLTLYTP